MNIGDRVKPVATFDFDRFNGPANQSDTGTVTGFYEDVDHGVYVVWDISGETMDHSTEDSEEEAFEFFGVEPLLIN